jgi:putative FmdB family regulatory protein
LPIYDYECRKCLSRFEVKRGFNEEGGDSCPKCGGEGRRIYLPTPLIFKGSGFYITDSRKNVDHSAGEGQPAKPSADKPVLEAKPEKIKADTESVKPATKTEPVKPVTNQSKACDSNTQTKHYDNNQ